MSEGLQETRDIGVPGKASDGEGLGMQESQVHKKTNYRPACWDPPRKVVRCSEECDKVRHTDLQDWKRPCRVGNTDPVTFIIRVEKSYVHHSLPSLAMHAKLKDRYRLTPKQQMITKWLTFTEHLFCAYTINVSSQSS